MEAETRETAKSDRFLSCGRRYGWMTSFIDKPKPEPRRSADEIPGGGCPGVEAFTGSPPFAGTTKRSVAVWRSMRVIKGRRIKLAEG